MPRLFWPAAIFASAVGLGGDVVDPAAITFAATVIMLIGGLPHGAYDIAIARRALALGNGKIGLFVFGYVAVALAMAALWLIAPALGLGVFLLISAIHFGADWAMVGPGLLRVTAGASVICIPAFFQTEMVTKLFKLMAGPQGELIAQLAVAATPVVVIVMLTALAQAYIQGERQWALAQSASFIGLAVMPPQIAFPLFFVFLHSPLHLRSLRGALQSWSITQLAAYGAAISCIAFLAGSLLVNDMLSSNPELALAGGFKLLSILTAPHLIVTLLVQGWLDERN